MSNWVVLKFGGSSVADARHWQTIAEQVSSHLEQGNRPLLVLSALKNVSNLLEALLHQALAGVHPNALTHLEEHHLGFAAQLGLNLTAELRPIFEFLTQQCERIHRDKVIHPKIHAEVVSCGERLSTLIGTEYLQNIGVKVNHIDARKLLKSIDNQEPWHHFTSAECVYEPTDEWRKHIYDQLFVPTKGVIVTQGFIASDKQNRTVLLGREGSDTSAAYLGSLLKAKQIEIWTDVTGVFSSNPREIKDTRQLSSLSYQQANLMASLGAKVLHPRAVKPAQKLQIPLFVKSTSNPNHPGTRISQDESAIETIGLVYEPCLLCTVSRKSLDAELVELESFLEGSGYDLLQSFKSNTNDTTTSYWIYTNSDSPKPDSTSLLNSLDSKVKASTDFVHDVSLVSIIGRNQDLIVKELLAEFADTSNETTLKIHQENKGFVSIQVESKDCIKIAQRLHKRIFY